MSELRWTNEDKLPESVRAAMRDLLPEALREAATKPDPGDGYMMILTPERIIGGGMYDGGWKLQSSHVQDERFHPTAQVVVHAYSDSQMAKGSVASDVVRTAADRRVIATHRLDVLVRERERLDQDIAKLRTELE
jgi:hypothetical protein